MSHGVSPLEAIRRAYEPRVPDVLRAAVGEVGLAEGQATAATGNAAEIAAQYPLIYGRPVVHLVAGAGGIDEPVPRQLAAGVVLSGGQAPGGHNVIAGLLDGMSSWPAGGRLLGFLGGPRGILEGCFRELTPEVVAPYRNTGGFDLLGSGRDKIETPEQLAACRATVERLGLAGLVVVGGDDSNTNAAALAEFLARPESGVAVVGVPKTIDGDLKGGGIEASFGFDTATKVYSELIGSIARDALSSRKYWHFIKLMGRSASHVTLECALQTHPNVALIAEEIEARELTLEQVAESVATVVRRRAQAGRFYGVCLVPEGLVEFVPEMRRLIAELNGILGGADDESTAARERRVAAALSAGAAVTFRGLPALIRGQLLLDRDSHGNVQVSQIDTEQLLVDLVARRIAGWREAGEFPGKFQVQRHFFGYEGRSVAPSNFDADYCYALGRTAAVLVAARRTGYACGMANLAAAPTDWRPVGIPITALMRVESRKGRRVPVVGKALVRIDAPPFAEFERQREGWAIGDDYRYPGPIQYFGPPPPSRRPRR